MERNGVNANVIQVGDDSGLVVTADITATGDQQTVHV